MYVDGKAVATIDLWSFTSESQRVVWAKSWSRVATNKITIKVISAPGRQRVDVDGMVVTR